MHTFKSLFFKLKDNLSSPCNECPFRKNSAPGWLGGATAADTIRYVMNEGDFACHKTRHKSPANQSRCYGSILFLRKNCKIPKYNKPLEEAVAKTDKSETDNILSYPEFFEHHDL